MIINHTTKTDNELNRLLESTYICSNINAIIDYITDNKPVFSNRILDKASDLDKKFQLKNKAGLTDDQCLIFAHVYNVMGAIFKDRDTSIPFEILLDIAKDGKVIRRDEWIQNNPYLKNIKVPNAEFGKISYTHKKFQRLQLWLYDTIRYQNYIAIPRICTHDHAFRYPGIEDDKTIWMTITPSEIVTMKKPVDEAYGKVLTLGCGLGYYAYMASEKENVDSVTIVEKDPCVIRLFKDNILPQFANRNKIEIIESDAFDFMHDLKDGVYDYCFADIWKNNTDTRPYFKMKSICEKKFDKTHISYWVENGIINNLLCNVYILLIAEAPACENTLRSRLDTAFLTEENDSSDKETIKAKQDLLFIKDLLTDVRINTVSDIQKIVQTKWLLDKLNDYFKHSDTYKD